MEPISASLSGTTIVLHGRLADLLGQSVLVHAPAGCSIAELRQCIATQHPHAAEAIRGDRVRTCVGDAVVPDSYHPTLDETVEFLPPVSGG